MVSALRYELDDYGQIGITLEKFDSLEEMDEFMKQFKDSNKVKEKYLNQINEFLKKEQAKKFLDSVKERENNGYIRGYASNMKKAFHVPLMYQNSLLDEHSLYINLGRNLQKKSVLCDIYYRKWHILPQSPTLFLRHELGHCVVHNGTDRIFIKEFIAYIKKLNSEERYFVLRCLCDKCNLMDDEKKRVDNIYKIKKNKQGEYQLAIVHHYPIGDLTDEELHEMIPEDKKVHLREGVDSEFEMKDMERLLEEYDLDEIIKNTDYYDDVKRKTR